MAPAAAPASIRNSSSVAASVAKSTGFLRNASTPAARAARASSSRALAVRATIGVRAAPARG